LRNNNAIPHSGHTSSTVPVRSYPHLRHLPRRLRRVRRSVGYPKTPTPSVMPPSATLQNGIAITTTPPVDPRCMVKSHRIGDPSSPLYHELVHESVGVNTPGSAIQSLSRPLPIAHDQYGSCCWPKRQGSPRLRIISVVEPTIATSAMAPHVPLMIKDKRGMWSILSHYTVRAA